MSVQGKKLIMKHFHEDDGDKEIEQTYVDMIINLLRLPFNLQGADAVELEVVVPILIKFKQFKKDMPAKGEMEIILDNEEYAEVCRRVKKGPYVPITEEALTFKEDIFDAETVDLEEKTQLESVKD